MKKETETQDNELEPRVYEIGYLIIPGVAQEQLSNKVSAIRGIVEAEGGKIFDEGEPKFLDLAYEMTMIVSNKRIPHKTGYFGWMKFEADPAASETIHATLKKDTELIRFMLIKTTKEDTLAPIKAALAAEVDEKAKSVREENASKETKEVKEVREVVKEESASKEEIDRGIDKLIIE